MAVGAVRAWGRRGTEDPGARLAGALGPGLALACLAGGGASLRLPRGEVAAFPAWGLETEALGRRRYLRAIPGSAPRAVPPLELHGGRRIWW
jgi:hypothetical protein